MGNNTIIHDCRGEAFKGNKIELISGKAIYCNIPLSDLKQTETHRSKHFYNMISGEGDNAIVLGMIALYHSEVKTILKELGKWKNLPSLNKTSYKNVPHSCLNGVSVNLCDSIADSMGNRCACTERYLNNLI